MTHALMCTKQAADYLKVSYRTLQNWRSAKVGPPYNRIGGLIRYRQSDLDEFVVTVKPTVH